MVAVGSVGLAGQAAAQDIIVPAPPEIAATSYILFDPLGNTILAESNIDKPFGPASITKLMTAYIVYKALREGRISLDDEVIISEKAWRMKGSRTFVEVGKPVSVEILLNGMVIQSGNDASVALAELLGGTEKGFVQMMNAEAKAMGLTGSNFVNSTGWPDPNHYMTARDIVRLAQAIISEFPENYRMYAQKQYTYNNITQYNRNRLLWQDPSVDGIKTGHTEDAGYCLVASAQREGMRLISVVLGAGSDKQRTEQSAALLSYGFRFYTTKLLFPKGETVSEVRVWGSQKKFAPVGVIKDLYVTVPHGASDHIKITKQFQGDFEAPVEQGRVVGNLHAGYGEKFSYEVPLVMLEDTPEGGLLRRLTDMLIRLVS